MAFECDSRAVGLGVWVNVQDDTRDITPIGALLISIKHPHVRDDVLLVILSEGWSGWRYVSERLKLCVAELLGCLKKASRLTGSPLSCQSSF
jgi:hypothetical protein